MPDASGPLEGGGGLSRAGGGGRMERGQGSALQDIVDGGGGVEVSAGGSGFKAGGGAGVGSRSQGGGAHFFASDTSDSSSNAEAWFSDRMLLKPKQ
jgi:hypothetical protein